ncbi:hypothetical protein COO60DRAFT_72662 [Scenedesmus sp. NREL 46B-D3]|nr:hypothetical protein COO60DRAFT_72662 [Scenedesmus sp. NREL 46B-D3]
MKPVGWAGGEVQPCSTAVDSFAISSTLRHLAASLAGDMSDIVMLHVCAAEAVAGRRLSSEGVRGLLSSAAAGSSAAKGAVLAQSKSASQASLNGASAAASKQRRWQNTEPTDACKPFDVAKYGHANVDSFCAKLNSLKDDELRELHAQAPLPSSTGGFPLRGCTHRCIVGSSFPALVAKMPENNLGWGGKCFNWQLDPTSGVPTQLVNTFSPNYDNSSLPDSVRVQGKQEANANVYYVESSRGDSRPAWRFDHNGADDIYDPIRKSMLIVQGFNDEMREVRPGFLLGRIFIRAGSEIHEIPIFFGLIQACTADGTFPTTPDARVQPPLGGQ